MIRGEVRFRQGATLEEALKGWRERNRDCEPPLGKPLPIVLVAAAGGGVRASYWTSLILSRATDQAPILRQRLFMGSGVSGGSLGLAIYRALLELETPRCGQQSEISLESRVALFHQNDFLAGLLAETLTGSILRSFVPIPFPDRS